MSEGGELSSIQNNTVLKSSYLGDKFVRVFSEERPEIEGAITREEWQSEVSKRITNKEKFAVLMFDVAGGGRLSELGIFPQTVSKIIEALKKWEMKDVPASLGRTYIEKSSPGSDEFLTLMDLEGVDFADAVLDVDNLIKAINELVNGSSGGRPVIYAGVALVDCNADTNVQKVLRGADLALKDAKEGTKKLRQTAASVFVFDENGVRNMWKDEKVDLGDFASGKDRNDPNLIEENAVVKLKEAAKGKSVLLVSPVSMKELNKENGQTRVDEDLYKLPEILSKAVWSDLEVDQNCVYKIGTVFAIILPPGQNEDVEKKLLQANIPEMFRKNGLEYAVVDVG